MTQTLQQALLKAGLVKEKPKTSKPIAKTTPHPRPISRPPQNPPQKKSVGFLEHKHHHHLRTDCEACGKSSPDVEYYEHKSKRLDKYWLCVRCADSNSISDQFRQTVQSSHSKTGMFRREYGATKVFK